MTEAGPRKAPASTIFERWAKMVTQVLRTESDLAGTFIQHPTRVGDAREALVKNVLERVLPSAVEIGTGQIVDCLGRVSKQIDVIIAHRNYPTLRFPDGSCHYLLESVLATIEVKSTLDKTSLAQALDNCKSVGALQHACETELLEELARSVGCMLTPRGEVYVNGGSGPVAPPSHIREWLGIVGRPECYVYGFSGYAKKMIDFSKAIEEWAHGIGKPLSDLELRHLPTVIAAEGCVAVRNQSRVVGPDGSWPMLGVQPEENPLGYLLWQLLNHLHRCLPVNQQNAYGVWPVIEPHLDPERRFWV